MILIKEAQLISPSNMWKKKKQSSEKKRTPFFTGDTILCIKKTQNTGFFKK